MKVKLIAFFIPLIFVFGCVEKIQIEDDNIEVTESIVFESAEEKTEHILFGLETNKLNYTLRFVIYNKANSKIENLKISESDYMSGISLTDMEKVTLNSKESLALQFGMWGDEDSFDQINKIVLLCEYDIDGKHVKSLIYIDYEESDVTLG